MNRETGRYGGFFNGRRGDLLTAAAGAVGLRDYGGDFDVRLREGVNKGGDGEVRGATEEDAHGLVQREAGDDGAECSKLEILPSWGAAMLRPYEDGSYTHPATTRL